VAERVASLPAGKPLQVAIFGRKGTGKSELAWRLWCSWPQDRVVIDVTGDVGRLHPDPETVDLEVPPPSRWPETARWDRKHGRLSLRYVPDHADPAWRDDMDRVVGLAFAHGHTLLWVEEVGLVAPSGQVMPHMRKALHMGRHQDLWMVTTCPRPMGVDPLVLAQADVVYCFDLPNPDDRRRVADCIGWNRSEIDEAVAELPEHGYLRYVAAEHELSIWPPLPLDTRRRRVAETHFEEGEPA
jgi:hypothetical protein